MSSFLKLFLSENGIYTLIIASINKQKKAAFTWKCSGFVGKSKFKIFFSFYKFAGDCPYTFPCVVLNVCILSRNSNTKPFQCLSKWLKGSHTLFCTYILVPIQILKHMSSSGSQKVCFLCRIWCVCTLLTRRTRRVIYIVIFLYIHIYICTFTYIHIHLYLPLSLFLSLFIFLTSQFYFLVCFSILFCFS